MYRSIVLLSVFLAASIDAQELLRTDGTEIKALETDVQTVVANTTSATVGLAGGSTVVVHSDGLLLTVSHVAEQKGHYLPVKFANGKRATAIVLGRHHGLDIAICQILEPGPWPAVEISDGSNLTVGDWVIALGFPISFDQGKPPAVRVGQLLRLTRDRLTTDSPIMGGDSGGPLFDIAGRLIGISCRCERENVDTNYFISMQVYRDHWKRLLDGAELNFNRQRQTIVVSQRPRRPAFDESLKIAPPPLPFPENLGRRQTLRPAAPRTASDRVIGRSEAICSVGLPQWSKSHQARVDVFVDGRQLAAGCRWSNPQTVVTKASLLGAVSTAKLECRLASGDRVGRWIGTDHDQDIALLEIDNSTFEDTECEIYRGKIRAGTVVVVPMAGSTHLAGFMVSEPRRFSLRQASTSISQAYLGVRTRMQGEGLFVYDIVPRSAAERYGVLLGDQILTVDQQAISDPQSMVDRVRGFRPGEIMALDLLRNEQPLSLKIPLGTGEAFVDKASYDQWGGGPFSVLRFGFPSVMAHDTPIAPEECGGPLLDAEGRVIGVNISRALRVATYAITSERIDQIVHALKK